MEYMPEFQVLSPATVEEAVELHGGRPGARFLAGGTDIVVNVRRGIVVPENMIDLTCIAEMRAVTARDGGGLSIGAGVTLAELADYAFPHEGYAAIGEAAAAVAAATHREVATVGGNLCLDTRCVFYNQSEWWRKANDYCLKYRGETCHVAPSGTFCFAAFSGDLAPALLVLDATVEIAGPEGRRTIPLQEMYNDDGADHLRLAPGEMVVAVDLPDPAGWRSGYAKARVRDAIEFPLAGAAVALRRDGDTVAGLRLALTGTNSCPLLIEGTDAFLAKALDDDALEALTKLLPKQIQPMTSTFTPPGYRRRVVANLVRALTRRLY